MVVFVNYSLLFFRIYLKLSTNEETSKQVYKVMFFDMVKYIYSESLLKKLYIKIKHKCQKNFFSQKKALQKIHSFFFRELQLITVLLLIHNSQAEAQGSSL